MVRKKMGPHAFAILLEIAIVKIEKAQKRFSYVPVAANLEFTRNILYMDL